MRGFFKKAAKAEYFSWLCTLVTVNRPDASYFLLFKFLFETEFKYFVPNDDNRSFEGINLRERFCEDEDFIYEPDYFDDPCSMLELIVALAYRCEERCEELSMREWFWKMLENADLKRYNDENFYDSQITVSKRVQMIINRTYTRNGNGGLFPLRRARKDQRKVELWYQMCEYLVENYYTEDNIL